VFKNQANPWSFKANTCLMFYDSYKLVFIIVSAGSWTLNNVYIFRNGIARSKRDGTRAETRFGLSAKRTSPFKSAAVSVQSTAGSRGVRISGQQLYRPCSDVQCKAAGYPVHSHLSPSLPLPCVTVCHQVPNALYNCYHSAIRARERLHQIIFLSNVPWFPKQHCFSKVPAHRPFVIRKDQHADEDKYEALLEWYWREETEVIGEKPAPVPLCPPQISRGLTGTGTWTFTVRGRLAAWTMAWSSKFKIALNCI